ncbi:hypothetical protein F383_31709 [Gossypium arboreum]|uniref:Uncharacterized protein n=1 Tax=Gossypium arboreum TaxID=29729 RepID=A0A0B0PJE3_GOSAR|nr:hypothetical protein F383_31709 [Gossypium arboreum]
MACIARPKRSTVVLESTKP